jgi:LmbE family N-acetylglucosaminyl deacetylase
MKSIYRGLRGLLNALGSPSPRTYEGLSLAEDFFHGPTLDWDPGREKVVVLAPHMDDEIIGCGGTIARHVDMGADVTVVYLTDGRRGSGGLFKLQGAALRAAEEALVLTRKEEARLALGCLGVQKLVFLDAPDTELADNSAVAAQLRTVLSDIRPSLVYVPCFLEHHPDHRAASAVLAAACAGTELDFMCFGYEVWTPLFPNCLVWIDATIERKRLAMAQYRSQLDDANDLMHAMNGLAAYRSVVRSRKQGRFAEAFCAMPRHEYERARGSFMQSKRLTRADLTSAAAVGIVSGRPAT